MRRMTFITHTDLIKLIKRQIKWDGLTITTQVRIIGVDCHYVFDRLSGGSPIGYQDVHGSDPSTGSGQVFPGEAFRVLKQSDHIDFKAALILAALFLATWLLWDTPIVYPIKIFVVMVHELGHAITALGTGGQVVGIQIYPEAGGVTFTRGGWPFVILSAGYLGSLLAGSVLLYLASRQRGGRGLMIALAVLIAASTLLFVRNVFGVIYGLLAAAALWFSAYRLPTRVNLYLVRFIAVACCLYALLDIRSDLFTLAPSSGTVVNDAVALSRLTGIPAFIWASLWLIVSLWVLASFLKSALRVED